MNKNLLFINSQALYLWKNWWLEFSTCFILGTGIQLLAKQCPYRLWRTETNQWWNPCLTHLKEILGKTCSKTSVYSNPPSTRTFWKIWVSLQVILLILLFRGKKTPQSPQNHVFCSASSYIVTVNQSRLSCRLC